MTIELVKITNISVQGFGSKSLILPQKYLIFEPICSRFGPKLLRFLAQYVDCDQNVQDLTEIFQIWTGIIAIWTDIFEIWTLFGAISITFKQKSLSFVQKSWKLATNSMILCAICEQNHQDCDRNH